MRAATTIRRGPVQRATRRPPGQLDSHRRWTDRRGLVSTNLSDLASETNGQIGTYNPATGNVEYVINAGRVVGTTGSGMTTTVYTVVRSGTTGDLVTLFPGY